MRLRAGGNKPDYGNSWDGGLVGEGNPFLRNRGGVIRERIREEW